jgi:hypothetical protein
METAVDARLDALEGRVLAVESRQTRYEANVTKYGQDLTAFGVQLSSAIDRWDRTVQAFNRYVWPSLLFLLSTGAGYLLTR